MIHIFIIGSTRNAVVHNLPAYFLIFPNNIINNDSNVVIDNLNCYSTPNPFTVMIKLALFVINRHANIVFEMKKDENGTLRD